MKWEDFLSEELLENPAMAERFADQLPLHRIGAQVAVRRNAMGFSQAKLAELAGVTQRQVSALENGKANVTIQTLSRMAKALGLSVTLAEGVASSPTKDVKTLFHRAAPATRPNESHSRLRTHAGQPEFLAAANGELGAAA